MVLGTANYTSRQQWEAPEAVVKQQTPLENSYSPTMVFKETCFKEFSGFLVLAMPVTLFMA